MQPGFDAFRSCICKTEVELKKFQGLVEHIVLATDIMDNNLKDERNARWNELFRATSSAIADQSRDRIVLEYLIQASDVAHTMQHWHVYMKWNERLFHEMYRAYIAGRADKNPADTWYQSELKFLDSYIIPLAGKLQECGVFGVSGDEVLAYALSNRHEWRVKGRGIVKKYVEKFCKGELANKGYASDDELPSPMDLIQSSPGGLF
jgi:3'5'-cyclic nucleotide phosphodiesterase